MTAWNWISLWRIFFGSLALFAVGRQLAVHVQLGYSVANFFSYLTNLSNIFAACILLSNAFARRNAAPEKLGAILRAMAVINMTVVGIVFTVLLRGADLGSLLPWVNVVVHYLMPCVIVLDWILRPPRMPLGMRDLLLCLIFPVSYLAYVLIRGSIVGWYPYPFLNPANARGYGGVAVYALGVAVVFIAGGWSLFAAARYASHA